MKKKTIRQKNGPIQQWGKRINWNKRVKAVCKPCWELKYCPYGPVVEDFPIKEKADEKSCRIFGHDCPVFFVSEPLTETKELRNISRSIPRSIQFKVLKRDNQICSECGKGVKYEEIEFDHIIPWSKGGPSNVHNVRLLCGLCNKKRGNRFEETYLIESLSEHIVPPVPLDFIFAIYEITKIIHEFRISNNRFPTPLDFCKFFGRRKVQEEDVIGVEMFNEISCFFASKKPEDLNLDEFDALKYRWGFNDGKFHKLKDTSNKYGISMDGLLNIEVAFINRLGFQVKITGAIKKRWFKK